MFWKGIYKEVGHIYQFLIIINSCLQFLLVLRISSHFHSAKGTGWKKEKPSRICKPIFYFKIFLLLACSSFHLFSLWLLCDYGQLSTYKCNAKCEFLMRFWKPIKMEIAKDLKKYCLHLATFFYFKTICTSSSKKVIQINGQQSGHVCTHHCIQNISVNMCLIFQFSFNRNWTPVTHLF